MALTDSFRSLRKKAANLARIILEQPLYSAGIALYAAGVGVAAMRDRKARLLSQGQKEVWERLRQTLVPGASYIWVHAASLGEFEQGRPLIERIRRGCPDKKIILTFFSPSGYEVRKNYEGADTVCYLPFDTPRRVRRFLDLVRPEKAIFIKYEIWRNYLRQLRSRGVETYLVSAAFRPGQAFFRKSWAWYGRWLRGFTHIFVQDEGSRSLLASIGLDSTVAGDTRFDRVTDIMAARRDIPEAEAFVAPDGNRAGFVMVIGSSWPEDEDIYVPWLNDRPDVRAIIAPHEFDARRLDKLRARFGKEAVLLSEVKADPALARSSRILIVDCFGLLSSLYRYADMAYIGGGFGAGIHNINEAAVYGIPVVFGPNHGRFIEAGEIISAEGGVDVHNRARFETFANRMLYDPLERQRRGRLAGEYIRSRLGASDRIFSHIFRS